MEEFIQDDRTQLVADANHTSKEVGTDSREPASKQVHVMTDLEKQQIEYEARHRGTTHGDFPHVPGGPA